MFTPLRCDTEENQYAVVKQLENGTHTPHLGLV
jgi:hypothetical protein